MKKWITKAEIAQILEVYSVRRNEFVQDPDIDYWYRNKRIKGYILSIEKSDEKPSKQIVVVHTRDDGKRTYKDIWERDNSGRFQFRFRNLWNQPLADIDYVRELEEENRLLRESEYLCKKQIDTLKKECRELKSGTGVHNARGAGRKPSKERLKAIGQVREMLESGYSEQGIMEKLGISRSTFFRYKKSINN